MRTCRGDTKMAWRCFWCQSRSPQIWPGKSGRKKEQQREISRSALGEDKRLECSREVETGRVSRKGASLMSASLFLTT